jgi:hypothetical protein
MAYHHPRRVRAVRPSLVTLEFPLLECFFVHTQPIREAILGQYDQQPKADLDQSALT